MKKILFIVFLFCFSYISFSQERELSDYEKYRLEQERVEYPQEEEVFYIVEDMPQFQGDDAKEFRKWIAQNVIYPKDAIKRNVSGKVIVSFIVNSDGNVTNAKVEKGIDPDLDAEAIRVVESSPKWIPGKQRGQTVNVAFTFPINFVIQEEQTAQEPIIINNYYYDDFSMRHNLYFGYNFYSPYYNPWYYGYGYYGYGYPYYSYGYYPYYGGYYGYGYPYYNHHGYYTYRPSNKYNYAYGALGKRGGYYTNSYKNTYSSGYAQRPSSTKSYSAIRSTQPQSTRTAVRTTQTPQTRAAVRTTQTTQTQSQRSYTPQYRKPTTGTPQYNRSATVRSPQSSQGSTYNRPSSTTRSSTYSRPSQSSSRSYSTPSRSSSSYSTPSRSSSSGSYSRSSGSAPASRSSSSGTRSSSSGSRR